MMRYRIQHALDTGRYHPAFYRWHPFPGPGPDRVLRYKSGGHHTEGFATLDEAQTHATELAPKLPMPVDVPEDGFEVRDVPEAGPDILLLEGTG